MKGKSLSFCVKDIIEGKVSLENVECIVTGTAFPSLDDILNSDYMIYYWDSDPEYAKTVVSHLWNQGKIIQPRLNNPDYIPPYIGGGTHWESNINDCH